VEECSSPEAFKKNATLARQMKALMKVTTKKDFKVSMMVRNYQTLHTQATDLFASGGLISASLFKDKIKEKQDFCFLFHNYPAKALQPIHPNLHLLKLNNNELRQTPDQSVGSFHS